MYYAVGWLRRRKARERWNTERSYWSVPDEPDTRPETDLTNGIERADFRNAAKTSE